EVRLRHGSVLAWVPQRAHGFIVRAPGLTALDLGTVFSVSADPTGTSRLFVFQGQVQALNDEGGNIAVCEAGSGVTRSAGCAPLPFALESGVAHARFEQVAGLAALTDPAETFSAVERIAREADVAARTIPAQDEVRNTKAENNTEDAMNSTRAIVLAGTLAVWNGMGAATTWHVAPEGDDAAAGASWEAPFKTISNAVAKAAIADEIVVSNGVYAVTVPVNVSKMLTVRALSSDPRDTIIDGGGVTNCVRLTATNTLFCGFTVSNGCWNGRPYGAGVYIEKGGVVSNCVITCCYAAWEENYGTHIGGGGLYTDYGVVTDCEISHNFVTNGCGGGVHMSGGNSSLKRCRIFGNRCTSYSSKSESGGGVYASGARVEACEIFDNRARKEGGGAALNSTAVLSLCLITGNQTEMTGGLGGGGVSTRGTGAFVTDCVISNNLAVGAGGGVYMIGDCVISNCFIERNSATGQGGGISSYLSAGYGLVSHTFIRNNTSTAADGGGVYFQRPASRLTMRNCLIEKNESVTGSYGGACGVGSNVLFMSCTVVTNRSKYAAGGIYLGNHTAYNTTGSVVSNCLVFGNVNQSGIAEVGSAFTSDMENFHYCFASNNVLAAYGVGNVSGDPMLENFAEGDYRLKPGSPCCNAGAYDSWMTGAVDLRGSRRICGPKVDIGAYERFYLLGTAIQVR
ncbi:MAG: choice-of-anchor Q domain-containing protein, partial [Kiritimatiellia bacterium]|nr:choice-of-anchor Q domain-containing protein [Kiritimatiellia bacterium]